MCHLFSCFCLSTPTKICKFVANYQCQSNVCQTSEYPGKNRKDVRHPNQIEHYIV